MKIKGNPTNRQVCVHYQPRDDPTFVKDDPTFVELGLAAPPSPFKSAAHFPPHLDAPRPIRPDPHRRQERAQPIGGGDVAHRIGRPLPSHTRDAAAMAR